MQHRQTMQDRQKGILLSLIQNIDGKAWAKDRDGWSKDADDEVCSWEGISCDPVDRQTVIGIFLPSADLSATIPPEIGRLTTLRTIEMPQNLLHGAIPQEVADLPHLEKIDIKQNELSGTIPLFASPLLRSVDFGHNAFSGRLPDNIGERHERMTDFDVTGNRLTGSIPDSFTKMEALDTLALSENQFSGTIPSSLGGCKVLRYLYIDNNYLMGTIPPQLARMDSPMGELWVQHNQLSGTIPAAIADLEDLFNFYIDGNKFTGTIPKALCRKELNADWFEDDDSSLDRNYCDSVGCPSGESAPYGVFPCVKCDDQHYNPYLGRVGQCIDFQQRDVLQSLYNATNGEGWKKLPVPWLDDNDYYCSFTGISCDKKKNIIKIELHDMNLQGTIPQEVGFLRYLEVLDLSDNEIHGFLPSDLRFSPLQKLDVSGNRLQGIVPPMLCLKAGINGNGDDGDFGCERMSCPVGDYSTSGTGTPFGDGEKCMPCPGSNFLSAKTCPALTSSSLSRDMSGGKIFGVLVLVGVLTAGLVFTILKIHKKVKNRRSEAHPAHENVSLNDVEFS